MHCHMALNSKSWAHPPLGEVSSLDNTDSMPCIASGLSHSPDILNGVASDVKLQDGVTFAITISATCNYYNSDLSI